MVIEKQLTGNNRLLVVGRKSGGQLLDETVDRQGGWNPAPSSSSSVERLQGLRGGSTAVSVVSDGAVRGCVHSEEGGRGMQLSPAESEQGVPSIGDTGGRRRGRRECGEGGRCSFEKQRRSTTPDTTSTTQESHGTPLRDAEGGLDTSTNRGKETDGSTRHGGGGGGRGG